MKKRKIIITSALPYANGDIHIGHLVEYIQTDIWARYQRLRGHDCYYICGSDAHGTAIMLKAEKENISPQALVTQMAAQQLTDLKQFGVAFDHFSSTDNETNREWTYRVYHALYTKGDIRSKTISQLYDPQKNIFLPDRFVKGECPKCGAKDQYGDNCESCGATYTPRELKNPYSVVSGATPIEKDSEHFFFELPHYAEKLQRWMQAGHLQTEVANKMQEWFTDGLQAWDISRDAPYFGFTIPNATDKYFYVWLDAPIGYISSFQEFAQNNNLSVDEFWHADSQTELYHFIGKDVMYFHSLFWPAMLMGSQLRTPTGIFVHGMLTVNGQKMSKSRGTFIKAATFADYIDPECLRYYYAAKLASDPSDIDLNLEDFRLRVNADLVNKVINIASRCAGFINKRFNATLAANNIQPILFAEFVATGDIIAEHYEQREFAKAMREIMLLADKANQYIDQQKPWAMIKEVGKESEVHEVCSVALNLFRLLMIYLQPVVPHIANQVEFFLNTQLTWQTREHYLTDHVINIFTPLLQRVEEEQIEAVITASKNDLASI